MRREQVVMMQSSPVTKAAQGKSLPDRPIVFVLEDDVRVRESLELLIPCEGWQPEAFSSAREFLARPRVAVPLPRARHFPAGRKWS